MVIILERCPICHCREVIIEELIIEERKLHGGEVIIYDYRQVANLYKSDHCREVTTVGKWSL